MKAASGHVQRGRDDRGRHELHAEREQSGSAHEGGDRHGGRCSDSRDGGGEDAQRISRCRRGVGRVVRSRDQLHRCLGGWWHVVTGQARIGVPVRDAAEELGAEGGPGERPGVRAAGDGRDEEGESRDRVGCSGAGGSRDDGGGRGRDAHDPEHATLERVREGGRARPGRGVDEGDGRGGCQRERDAGAGVGCRHGADQEAGGDRQPRPAGDARRADAEQGREHEERRRHDERPDAEVDERVVRRGSGQVVGPHGPDIEVQQHDPDHAHGLRGAGQSPPGEDRRRRERGHRDGRGDRRPDDQPVGHERVDHVEHRRHREQHDADGEQHCRDADATPGCRGRCGDRGVDLDRRPLQPSRVCFGSGAGRREDRGSGVRRRPGGGQRRCPPRIGDRGRGGL